MMLLCCVTLSLTLKMKTRCRPPRELSVVAEGICRLVSKSNVIDGPFNFRHNDSDDDDGNGMCRIVCKHCSRHAKQQQQLVQPASITRGPPLALAVYCCAIGTPILAQFADLRNPPDSFDVCQFHAHYSHKNNTTDTKNCHFSLDIRRNSGGVDFDSLPCWVRSCV